ncbi:MAG: energy-coupling factor ABC transporter permease [Armatimonadota bacterium]
MSHIHLPDGVLPPWLWISGYLLVVLLVGVVWRVTRLKNDPKRFALLGIFSALMILVMTIEIAVYHVNLSVVTGIILGPALGIIAALIVNIFLAFIGHGGFTVAGLNTLVVAVEMLAGYGAFRLLQRIRLPLALAGFLAVVIGLGLGAAASYGVIVAGAPAINQTLQEPEHEHAEEAGHAHDDEALEQAAEGGQLNLKRLAALMFGVGAIGWVLEGLLSMAILTALNRVYPDLVIRKE